MLGSACTLAACAAPPTSFKPQRPPPPPPAQALPPALIAVHGTTPELKVTAVDGAQLAQLPESSLLRDAAATSAKSSVVGIWVRPGARLVHSQFVRNIEGGINLAQGNLRLVAVSGHTYLVQPVIGSDRGKVSFKVVDYGAGFPRVCLPGAISNARNAARRTTGTNFTREDIATCVRSMKSR